MATSSPNPLHFSEEQSFDKEWKWLYFLLISLPLFILYSAIKNPTTNNIGGFFIVFVACLVVIALIKLFKLSTKVDNSGIYYRFPPTIPDWECISWNQIQSVEVISYNPLSDFGGWGIRTNGASSAYIVSGHDGLQIVLKTGGVVIIGTNKAQELTTITNQINKFAKDN